MEQQQYRAAHDLYGNRWTIVLFVMGTMQAEVAWEGTWEGVLIRSFRELEATVRGPWHDVQQWQHGEVAGQGRPTL
jgi:hypothetical protein